MSYAREKFVAAVDTLATGPGRIRERLEAAYMTFHPVRPDDFPTSALKSDYEEIHRALTRVDAKGDEGRLRATLNEMDEEEAVEIARKIVDLKYELCK